MRVKFFFVAALLLTSGCTDRREPTPLEPTGPSGILLPAVEEFEVAGVVTDDRGAPLAGALVTMRYYLRGRALSSSVESDSSGGFRVGFSANPPGANPGGPGGFLVRVEVMAAGFEPYWRSLYSTGQRTFLENFRLSRQARIAAGESVVLSIHPDVGECLGWVAEVCGIVLVMVPAPGQLTIEATPATRDSPLPPVEVCCVSGSEVYGNPIGVRAAGGREIEVKVGLKRGFTTTQSFVVKTAFEPF
jgi:hypothetical protein